MEVCSSVHSEGRRLHKMGMWVRLKQFTLCHPLVKINKNDAYDVVVNFESASRQTMRFVPIKWMEKQDMKAVHRVRALDDGKSLTIPPMNRDNLFTLIRD